MYQCLILQIDKCVRSFVSASHVIRFVDQRTGNLRNKTIKEQMYTKNKTIWQNSFSSFNIFLLLPQPALCNISLLKTIYTILSNSLFFSYSYFLALFPTSNSKGKFVPYISKDSGQLNCSWNNSIVPGTSCSWNN